MSRMQWAEAKMLKERGGGTARRQREITERRIEQEQNDGARRNNQELHTRNRETNED